MEIPKRIPTLENFLNEQTMGWKPLPDFLEVKKDGAVEGHGLFATKDIPAGTCLGISHKIYHATPEEIDRTALGGYYNHSDNPNAEKREGNTEHYKFYELYTTRNIEAGEEITVTYTFYTPGEQIQD